MFHSHYICQILDLRPIDSLAVNEKRLIADKIFLLNLVKMKLGEKDCEITYHV